LCPLYHPNFYSKLIADEPRRRAYAKDCTMQNQIYTLYHATIDPAKFETFKALAEQIVEATSNEPDALTYEYVVSADHTVVHIIERYRTRGLLPHLDETFTPFAERFLGLATIDKAYVYGETTPEIRVRLDAFGAEYLTPFAGFSR
jgi:quinol monooxygenase YgiN